MENSRPPKAAYSMLYRLDQNGRQTWVTHIKEMLFRYGFGMIFIYQEVGDRNAFIKIFCERVKDCALQEWQSAIQDSSKLRTYCTFKTLLEPEKYLQCIEIRKFRIALGKFRCSNHKLAIEAGRLQNINY